MFETTPTALVRILVASVVTYAAVLLTLRLSGKRSLAKWSAFDFVVTIALGSALATAVLSRDVSISEGTVGIALLCWKPMAISAF